MTNKNILSPADKSCCGCGACFAICQHKAISFDLNKQGFFSPSINIDICNECGLCKKVCFKFTDLYDTTTSLKGKDVAGAYSTNTNTHRQTTSGGIAYELARWGIEHGYKIAGVIYDYTTDRAKTVIVDSTEKIELLKGSKYIQSDTSEALAELLEDARYNKENKYIFTGTPCQIYGVRKIIDTLNLQNEFILADLFCHGVPSYLVWNPYINRHKQQLGKLHNVNFRYKGNGWHQYTIRLQGEEGEYCKMAYRGDLFFRFFFDNIALNTSCFSCILRKERVAADLRLGDFLGEVYEHREDGVSAVLIASEKGREIIHSLESEHRIYIDKVMDADCCLPVQCSSDYKNLDQRNEIIAELQKTTDLTKVYNNYFRRLPLKKRIRATIKNLVSKLPVKLIIDIRRISHNLTYRQ